MDAIELLEEADLTAIQGKLQQANLDKVLCKEVMEDAHWPERSKKGMTKHGAPALAKALNAIGVSAKHKDAVLIVPSLAYLILDRVKLHKRLNELIKAANPPTTPAKT